jgi:hypothetical protein
MLFTEFLFESGGYLLFMRSKLFNQEEFWQNENLFYSHLFTHYIPSDEQNVTLRNGAIKF